MNILFLTVTQFRDIEASSIYTDLMRSFRDKGHNIYIVSPLERREKLATNIKEKNNIHILGVKTLNITKTNFIEKGVGYVLFEYQFKRAVKHYLKNINFDLVICTTPPNSYRAVLKYYKQKNAITYLLQKDFFVQSCLDLGLFTKKSLFYKFFRRQEKKLFELSDFIGCMSPANIRYILENNPDMAKEKVEICPNSIALQQDSKYQVPVEMKNAIRKKFAIPIDKPLFIYGGNIGIPQGIDFVIKVLEANSNRNDMFFCIVGSGTKLPQLMKWYEEKKPKNILIHSVLPKTDYDELVSASDIGLLFLDHRSIEPNFPSRLLTYLEYSMPVLAATDKSTDVGTIAMENGFGLWSYSDDVEAFNKNLDYLVNNPTEWEFMGKKGHQFLLDNYTVSQSYEIIMRHFES